MRYRLESVIECSHDEMVAFSKALSVMLPLMAPNVRIVKTFLTADVKVADTPSATTQMIQMIHPTQNIEAAIVAAGANVAPRVTPADVEANIVSEWYFTAGDGAHGAQTAEHPGTTSVYDSALDQLTFCVLVLGNGFTVTGQSACVSPENFNAETGRRIARESAVAKIRQFMDYELRSKLASA